MIFLPVLLQHAFWHERRPDYLFMQPVYILRTDYSNTDSGLQALAASILHGQFPLTDPDTKFILGQETNVTPIQSVSFNGSGLELRWNMPRQEMHLVLSPTMVLFI